MDYIPSTSLLGAYKALKLAEKGVWGGDRKDEEVNLYLTDAYPCKGDEKTLNVPSLVTLYKEREEDEYYVDAVKDIIDTVEGKRKWGQKQVRLKKGPRHWYMKGDKAFALSVKRTSTNILKLDDELKTAYQVKVNGEKTGYLAHIESLYPGQTFCFEVTGEGVDTFIETLKEGVFVGSFKTKGYGMVKLVDYKEGEEEEKGSSKYYVLDFYGSVSYDYYDKLKKEVSKNGKILFESVGIDKRKIFNYDEWEIEYVVRTGSVIVLKYDGNLYDLVKDSIKQNRGGKVVVNHPIHGL